MLLRTIARRAAGAAGAARAAPRAPFVRFQTTAPAGEKTPPGTMPPAPGPAAESAAATTATTTTAAAAALREPGAGTRAPRKHPFNRKLYDIVGQVKKAVAGVTDAGGPELAEALDVFEEGAAYLREIQQAEGIADDALFSVFQPVLVSLFDLVVADNANLGTRSVDSVLAMLAEQRVAHTHHFLEAQRHALRHAADADVDAAAYARVLQLWIAFLDYSKRMAPAGAGRLIRGNFAVYRDRGFRAADALRLAYFALVCHCIRTGEDYDLATTVKILQVKDALEIPPLYLVTATVARLGLRDAVQHDLAPFVKKVSERDAKNMDPNGTQVARQLDRCVRTGSVAGLRRLYGEIKEASVQNDIPVSEQTLNRVMHAFIEVRAADDALAIFAAMCSGLIAKPSSASWELAIKALGHPSSVGRMSPSERAATLEKVEATFNAMVAAGVPVRAKVLGVFVGSLSNLDRQDLVAQYLKQYSNVPVVHMARNNILVGMTLNKQLVAAEQRMREFLAEDPSFVPSTTVMNTFLAHYVAEGNDKAVEGILDFMTLKGIEENIVTVTTLLNYYFKTYRNKGMVPDVNEVIADVIKDTQKWDQHMVATLIDGLVKDGVNMDAARAVFKYFCETRKQLKHSSGMLTSMIKAEMEFGSVHNAEDLFAWYIRHLKNETVMYNMMVRGLLKKKESLALKYYSDLCAQRPFGVAPNFYTYFFLMEHFKKKNDRTRIQWVLDEIATAQLLDFGRDLPRTIRALSRDYLVDPGLLASLPGAN